MSQARPILSNIQAHVAANPKANSSRNAVTEMIGDAIDSNVLKPKGYNPKPISWTVGTVKGRRGKTVHGHRVGECNLGSNFGKPIVLPDGTLEGYTGLGKMIMEVPMYLYPEKQKDQLKAKVRIALFMLEKKMHAYLGTNLHGKKFKEMADNLGFEGKMANVKATRMLEKAIAMAVTTVVDFPLGSGDKKESKPTKQTYLKKHSCKCADVTPLNITKKSFDAIKARGLFDAKCTDCGHKMAPLPEGKPADNKTALAKSMAGTAPAALVTTAAPTAVAV